MEGLGSRINKEERIWKRRRKEGRLREGIRERREKRNQGGRG